MITLYALVASVVIYAVLQIVALYVLSGMRWRLAFGVAIPAAACVVIGIVGHLSGAGAMASLYFLVFAPIGSAVLAIILASHVLTKLRKR